MVRVAKLRKLIATENASVKPEETLVVNVAVAIGLRILTQAPM
jgi:hypothetical protein